MKDHSKMADNAKNEFRQFAWNLASSISQSAKSKNGARSSQPAPRVAATKRARTK